MFACDCDKTLLEGEIDSKVFLTLKGYSLNLLSDESIDLGRPY
jgi:hypothetical protein